VPGCNTCLACRHACFQQVFPVEFDENWLDDGHGDTGDTDYDSDWHEGSINSDNAIYAAFSDDDLDDSGVVEDPVNPGMTSDDDDHNHNLDSSNADEAQRDDLRLNSNGAEHDVDESDAANHVESEIEPMSSNNTVDATASGVDHVDPESEAGVLLHHEVDTNASAEPNSSAYSAKKKLHSL